MATRIRKHNAEQQDAVGAYLEAIGRHELLTKDDEARLGSLVMDGLSALERLDSPERISPAVRRRLNDAVGARRGRSAPASPGAPGRSTRP